MNVSKGITTIKALFHLPLLLLILYPYFVGLLINPSIADHREILILLSWFPILLAPVLIFRKKIIENLVIILLFLNGFASLVHWVLVKAPLSATGVFVFLNSNSNEIIEFVLFKNSWRLVLLLPYLAILFWAFRSSCIKEKAVSFVILSLFLTYSLFFVFENIIHERFLRKGAPVLVKTIVSFYQETKALQNTEALYKSKHVDAVVDAGQKGLTIILVIGESANRNHMSIYGYNNPTTPKLLNRSDLYIFDNVISPYCHTLDAVRAALTEANIDNKMPFNQAVSIIDVAKPAGYKTYWLSNQSPLGIWDNFITVLAKKADVCSFFNVSGSSSTEAGFKKSDDICLIEPLKKALNDTTPFKLIIVHLMGSHGQYHLRYPSSFQKFNYGKDKKNQTIAQYDNSILYTDFVLDSIFTILERIPLQKNNPSALLYFSDHGENVYDKLDFVGHDYADTLPYSIVEIPFVLWMSKQYQEANPDMTKLMAKNVHSPYMTDDLFHSLISLMQVKSPVLDSSRSIFTSGYNSLRPRMLENGHRYYSK
ncbi:MAG TPA: sulfatase-like hydrolase/transferase [Bacteroidales bacterium]